MVDASRFLLVGALALVIYAAALVELAVIAVGWWRRRVGDSMPVGHPPRRRPRGGAFLGLASFGTLCLAWAFVEPYWPKVERVIVTSRDLQEPIRIVQLSDLHSDPTTRLEDTLADRVARLRPDLVVFTGDAINSEGGLHNFRRCMHRIAEQFPTFGVKGNWEAWWFSHLDVFAGTGVTELDGEAVPITVRGQEIWVAGAAVESESRIRPMLAALPRNRFVVFLHHFPATWRRVAGSEVDLHLAGDTHGGQIALPVLGPLIRIKRDDGVFYPTGLLRRGNLTLYVNRGIGMEGRSVPRVRFNRRPEITLLEVRPGSGR